MNKVILFELNEVPFRVIDKYVEANPRSCLARVLKKGGAYQSENQDTVQLDPWIAWPTLHRGVTDAHHGIFHLGQGTSESDVRYPPIWQIVKAQTDEVGVFGSLTSSTVPSDANSYSFYIPDYFAAEPFANPSSLLPFQELNLRLTRNSGRNVSRKIPLAPALAFAKSATSMGISANTVSQIVRQLASESLNKDRKTRRRSIQPLLMLDLFMRQMRKKRPIFATFYTNHVAAAMHRYWAAYFPEDYREGEGMPGEWVQRFAGEIPAAMDRLDEMLAKLVEFVDADPDYTLVVATAIGQAAIPTGEAKAFLTVTDTLRFLTACGLSASSKVEAMPAMVPCITVSIPPSSIRRMTDALRTLKIGGEHMVEDPRPVGPMSFDVKSSGTLHIFIQWDNYAGDKQVELNGKTMSFAEAGLGMMVHEDGVNCSAQHVPTGAVLVYGAKTRSTRGSVLSTDIAPNILTHLDLKVPDYMRQSVSIFS